MASVMSEHEFVSVSVDQLKQELTLLSLAGFGGSMIDFRTSNGGNWSNAVTMKVFKPLDEPKAGK